MKYVSRSVSKIVFLLYWNNFGVSKVYDCSARVGYNHFIQI